MSTGCNIRGVLRLLASQVRLSATLYRPMRAAPLTCAHYQRANRVTPPYLALLQTAGMFPLFLFSRHPWPGCATNRKDTVETIAVAAHFVTTTILPVRVKRAIGCTMSGGALILPGFLPLHSVRYEKRLTCFPPEFTMRPLLQSETQRKCAVS